MYSESKLLEMLVSYLLKNSMDLDPEYARIVDENLWDLI